MNPQFNNAIRTNRDSAAQLLRNKAFTLVELMVVIVIISIVASLSLAGLGVARQRSKRDVTRATIFKIDSVIQPMYEGFFTRTVPSPVATSLGRLMTYEMPDQWQDVRTRAEVSTLVSSTTKYLVTGPVNRFATAIYQTAQRNGLTDDQARTQLGTTNSSAECLYLCAVRSGFEPDALENFRPAEVADRDGDGAKEFVDAAGQPIYFMRWAPGYSDPAGRGGQLSYAQSPPSTILTGSDAVFGTLPAMVPLIYSCGVDGSLEGPSGTTDYYGLERPKNRSTYDPFEFPDAGKPLTSAALGTPEYNAYRDNITNHDFLGRGR
jgi:prepilin-type N-terminal cleavage/methylation domain-containing protein